MIQDDDECEMSLLELVSSVTCLVVGINKRRKEVLLQQPEFRDCTGGRAVRFAREKKGFGEQR